MTQISNHTAEINNQSICHLQAQWNVTIQGEGNGLEFWAEGDGNTFEEALQNLYYNNPDREWWGYNEQFTDLCLSGDYTLGNESKAFEFPLDADSFATMAHYLFAKGTRGITIEDLMTACCKPSEFEDRLLTHGYLPLSAFTAGSHYLDLEAA